MELSQQQHDPGNVLFMILIAVALFAALSYAVTQSNRGGRDSSQEQANISSAVAVQYAVSLRNALQRLQLSGGCELEQISFERPPFDGSDTKYVNANAPADSSCHVFHPWGGGLLFQETMFQPSGSWSDYWDNTDGSIFMLWAIEEIGTTSPELVYVRAIDQQTCYALNERLGVEIINDVEIFVDETAMTYAYAGDLSAGFPSSIGGDSPLLAGQSEGCFWAASGIYAYYSALVEQ